MGHSVKRKEDPRFIRGQGEYIDDVNLPGQLWLDIVRSPYAHATIKGIDATEALKIPGVARRHHRRGPREGRAPLDADPRRRQADGAADRHGHVPGAGGRRGRRHDRYIAADGVAAVVVDYEPLPVVVDPYKALEPDASVLRPDRGPDKQNNHIWHWESGDGPRPTPAIAAAEVRVSEDIYIPRIHVASIETCGCVADWNAVTRPADAPHDDARRRTPSGPCSRSCQRPPGAEHPGQDPRHRRRLRRQGAGLPGLRARGRRLADRRQAGQVDRGPLGEPPGRLVRPRLPHPRRAGARRRTARSPALKVKTIADHGYTDAAADPSKFPAGLFNVITGSYDFPNAFVEVDGVYTNKPPGGVAYRCSFRVTEAVHAIERMVDILAHEIGKDPAAAPDEELHPARAVPVQDADRLGVRLGQLPGRAPEGAWT